jgi:hypothetical protein
MATAGGPRASVRRASPTSASFPPTLYAAVRPTTDAAFALVLPEVNANTMDIFLDRFAACLAQNTHAIVLLDQPGWHGEKALAVPVGGAILFLMSCLEPTEVID